MQSKASTVDQYIAELPENRKQAISELRRVIKKHIPKGFEEGMGYGIAGYSVPHSRYPDGYHCDPKSPLPFLGFASQKNFIAVYHMGIYADAALMKWFTDAHAKASSKKLDMGKSCLRYKQAADIPYDLIGQLVSKITPDEWIDLYESKIKRAGKAK